MPRPRPRPARPSHSQPHRHGPCLHQRPSSNAVGTAPRSIAPDLRQPGPRPPPFGRLKGWGEHRAGQRGSSAPVQRARPRQWRAAASAPLPAPTASLQPVGHPEPAARTCMTAGSAGKRQQRAAAIASEASPPRKLTRSLCCPSCQVTKRTGQPWLMIPAR